MLEYGSCLNILNGPKKKRSLYCDDTRKFVGSQKFQEILKKQKKQKQMFYIFSSSLYFEIKQADFSFRDLVFKIFVLIQMKSP